ncbi:Rad50 [Kluyveromyces lactis]|nr:Rad50 [Kluyveromyces lactis]
MSAIYKLSIQGIRSFDSNDRETIEFGKPLTLIVGTNGSGKTTIIECLKYATTGDLPPNSKNGAFIHDPKITGEKDIRAQVKLAFTNAKGVNMIVTRNIQLLAKKNANTFKTLEGQLVAINHGERTTLSTRANELDQQIPLYLGVPKAILDYVIFCHQEDSLWPLSEPSILKKRFDEIFQAMKFTKALDNLKTIKKDISIDIKLLKQSVEHLKTDKDRSTATKVNISKLENKIEEYQKEVKSIEHDLNIITKESDALFSSNQKFQETLSKLDNLKHNKTSLKEQIQRLQSSIEILPNSKSELEDMLQNFQRLLEEKNIELSEYQSEKERLLSLLSDCRNEQQEVVRLQGELGSKKNQYETSKIKMNTILTELSELYNISKESVTSEVSTMLHTANKNLENLLAKHRFEETTLEEKLSVLRNSFAKKEQQLSYISSDLNKLADQTKKLRNRLNDKRVSEEDLKVEKEALNNYESKLKQWNTEKIVDAISTSIKTKNQDILSLEDELEVIQQQITKANQHSDLYAKLSLLKASESTKRKDVETIKKQLEEGANLVGVSFNLEGDLLSQFNSILDKKKVDLKKIKNDSDMATKEFIQYENQLQGIEEQIYEIESNITSIESRLKESLPDEVEIDTYDEELRDSEESYRIALENLKMHKTTLEFNLKALEVAQNEDCCYLCQRKFNDVTSSSKLIEDLSARTNKNFQIALETTAKEMQTYLHDLKSCYDDVLSHRKYQRELSTIKDNYARIKHSTEEKRSNQQEKFRTLQNLESKLATLAEKLQPNVSKLLDTEEELSKLTSDLRRVEEELSIYISDEKLETIETLHSKQKRVNNELRALRKDISDLQIQKEDKSKEYNNLLNLIREKNSNINNMESALQEYLNITKEVCENESIIESSKKESEILTEEVNDLKLEISSTSSSLDERKAKHRQLEVEARERKDKIESQVADVNELVELIQNFEINDAPRFIECEEKLSEISNSVESKTAEIKSIEDSINNAVQKLKDSDNEFKNIKLNIDLLSLKCELKRIENAISSMDVEHAEQERNKYQEDSLRLRSAYEKLSSENAGKLGEIKQLQNQISNLTNQLQTDYKNIDEHYQREWIKLQTKSLVTDDIDTYSRALDSAIMKYHSIKMKDINRIIDELWKRTYSGTDVDTIKIKTDEVSNVRGKSYNYRVVMYKQDAELDMRGRCSAGQKVLAAIIIRLALSETFGVNCGVIALDEPTTNLDEENIESLARSLATIIEVRRHQKNFQLIVITHDEKFLNHMNASSYADHFYKVKRDDRQKSQIEWVDINKVNP